LSIRARIRRNLLQIPWLNLLKRQQEMKMTKFLSALAVVLCLSLFGAPVASAFAETSAATSKQDGDGKKKHKKGKKGKKGKKHAKKHGKKHGKKGKKGDKK
jgi:hypothetical protein